MNLIPLKKLSVYLVLIANLMSILSGTIIIFIRDLIVFSYTFSNLKSKYFLFLMSGMLLMLYLLNSDFTVPAISKFRNFIFFPFFIYTLIQFDKYFVILK